MQAVQQLLNAGYTEVVDADLSGYFDTIPHAELMQCVARRVSDKAVLHLIKLWLVAPVEEQDARGRVHRTTRNKDDGRGSPQGSPISPLLANLYMRRFVLGWKTLGHEQKLQARIVNYADDFVICCRGTADEAMAAMRNMIDRLKLTVNETKTHICHVPAESFDFLGYTLGRCYSPRTGQAYLGIRPAKQGITALPSDQRDDQLPLGTLGPRRDGGPTQPHITRLGQLFLAGFGEPSLSSCGPSRSGAAPPVVVSQAQAVGKGNHPFPRTVCVRRTGARRAPSATTQPSVGESVIPCPRAGCGKTARPVRRAGCGNGAGFG